MRIVIAILALLAFSVASPAFAAPGKVPPGQSTSQGSNGSGKPDDAKNTQNSGKPEVPEKPAKPGQPGRGSDGPNGASHGPGAAASSPVDQDEALRAVERGEAVPLSQIVTIAEGRPQGGHVVNARLVRIEDFLLYQLTMLDDTGRSWRDYYYARSGNPVESN